MAQPAISEGAKGLRVANMLSLLIALVFVIIVGVIYYLAELYLVVYIFEIVMVILNVGYLFVEGVHSTFNKHKLLAVYAPVLVQLILTIVEFFRFFISWIRYPSGYLISNTIIALIFLIIVIVHNGIYGIFARKCSSSWISLYLGYQLITDKKIYLVIFYAR